MGREDQKTEPVKRTSAILYAAKLSALGARPPTILGLLPFLAESTIKNIYEEVNGTRSKKGPTPHKFTNHFVNPINRLQATYAIILFNQYRSTGIRDIESMISTYERYLIVFGAPEKQNDLTFDRFVILIKSYINENIIRLDRCSGCGKLHAHALHEILNSGNCPLIKLIPGFNESYNPGINITNKSKDIDEEAPESVFSSAGTRSRRISSA